METQDPTSAVQRIDALLDELAAIGDPAARERAEDIVRLLLELYGAGLARIMETVVTGDGPVADRLVADPLVASLLVLHDLHPVDLDTRVEQALESVRPYLGSHAGGVTYLGVDDDGVAHLQLEGSCSSCPSSSITVQHSIERAIVEAAPEVVRVDVVEVAKAAAAPALLQIQPLHPYADAACPAV
jgi:Fe-S cluster biogenesis protein NfuA